MSDRHGPAEPASRSRVTARRRDAVRRWLALITAALAVRGALFAFRGDYLDWDEALYLLLARSFLAGDGPLLNGLPHTALGPFMPAATALLALLSGVDLLVAQRLLSALAGALLLLPVWYLLRLSVPERTAWSAVSLMVAWPALIDVVPKLGPMWRHMYAGSEPMYLLLLFASLAAAEAGLRRRDRIATGLAAASGVLLALAYLTRAEAVVFGVVYAAARIIQSARAREIRRAMAVTVIAALGFLAGAAPHLLYLHRATGTWMASGQTSVMRPAAETLQQTFRSDRHMLEFVRSWYRLAPDHTYLANPYWGTPPGVSREVQARQHAAIAAAETPGRRDWGGRLLDRFANYLYMLWSLTGPVFLPFVVLGLVASRKREMPTFVVVGFVASLVVGLCLAVLPRFFLYLVPVLALWSASGAEALAASFGRYREAGVRLTVLALVAAGLFIVGRRSVGELAQRLSLTVAEDRRASESLSAAVPPGAAVMHWHPRFAYWAGWEWRTMPYASLDATAHYAARLGVRYILLARGGYQPVRVAVPHFVVVLDAELAQRLATLPPGPGGGHVHPGMVLEDADPVGGYPAGLLRLSGGGSDER